MAHPDPAYGVAGSEPPLSYSLPDTAPANAETPAGPDIVARLLAHVDTWRRDAKIDAIGAVADMLLAAGAIEYLRNANALHVADDATIRQLRADIVRLNAELDAARGVESR